MRISKSIAFSFLALLGPMTVAHSQGFYFPGGRSLVHLHTAWTLDKGMLTLHASSSSFYKTVLVTDPSGGKSSITFWDVQGTLGLHMATSRHLEVGLSETIYQDTHRGGGGYDLPSDLTVGAKLASFGGVQSRFRLGMLVQGRLPLAKHHNVIFEPYTAGRFEAGVMGLLSYSSDLLIPESGFNAHLNIGFWHHNDVGKTLTGNPNDKIVVSDPSREWLWGLGLVIPTHQFDFALEFFGRQFIVRPPVTAYSREDYAYVTPSVMFRVSNRISFSAGFDARLSASNDKTAYGVSGGGLPIVNPDLPSYPSWRLRLGSKIHLTKPEAREIERPLFTEAVHDSTAGGGTTAASLQEALLKERQKTELAEQELEQIRADRKKMETMLARLRQILQYGKAQTEVTEKEGDDKKKVTKKDN